MVHHLKIQKKFFNPILSGKKRFEVRKDDRTPRFSVGDTLLLEEIGDNQEKSGRTARVLVDYIYRGELCRPGYCIIYLPTYLYFITMPETTAPIPLQALMVAIAWFFFCLPCIFAEDIALRLFPDADDLVCKKENLRELEVLLEAQKADVGKEIKNVK